MSALVATLARLARANQPPCYGARPSGACSSSMPGCAERGNHAPDRPAAGRLEHASGARPRRRPAAEGLALACMDIFAGCGGLSEGLHQEGAAVTKWAIEYEGPAAEAFRLNNPGATVWAANCNVILAAAMAKAGLSGHCVASPEARPPRRRPAPPRAARARRPRSWPACRAMPAKLQACTGS